jgi:hypothetical protein
MRETYKEALKKAKADYELLTMKEREMAVRKSQLKETIKALEALCAKPPDLNSFSLADAVRLVVSSGSSWTATGIRDRLEAIGFDLSKYKNPMASIHTAVNRMIENQEMHWMPDEEGIEAGENLKVPTLPTIPAERLYDTSGVATLSALSTLGVPVEQVPSAPERTPEEKRK